MLRTARLAVVPVLVFLLATSERGSAVLPGANGKVAFASARAGNFEIYVVNPDTTGGARLTNDPGADSDPAWSSDGKRISFTTNRSGSDDIFVMNADGSGPFQLTTSPGSDSNSTWAPLNRNLAFASTRDGDAEIFVMNEDGTGQTQLTFNDIPDATPAWSPDGGKIAFRSERDGNSEIYAMEVDGTDVVRLTTSAGADVSPSWSPDGQTIAFASDRDGNFEIYAMDADGGNQRRLTRNLDTDLDPAFSPNGRSIAFSSNRDANREIYVMSTDGTDQTRLTTDAAEDTTPDWQWQAVDLPPPTPIEEAAFRPARWKESVFFGALRVEGRVPGLAKLQLALRRGKRVVVAAGLTISKGSFVRTVPLPRDLTPGPYRLEVTASGSPTELSSQRIGLRLAAPPEGVVSQAWASSTVEGPPLERIPSTSPLVWAHFQLAAFPRRGGRLATTWLVNGKRPPGVRPKLKPRRSPVIAWLGPPRGRTFPSGRYTCVLSSGNVVVKRLRFRVS